MLLLIFPDPRSLTPDPHYGPLGQSTERLAERVALGALPGELFELRLHVMQVLLGLLFPPPRLLQHAAQALVLVKQLLAVVIAYQAAHRYLGQPRLLFLQL